MIGQGPPCHWGPCCLCWLLFTQTVEPLTVPKLFLSHPLVPLSSTLLGVIVIVQALVAIGLTQFLILPKLGVQAADAAGGEVRSDPVPEGEASTENEDET